MSCAGVEGLLRECLRMPATVLTAPDRQNGCSTARRSRDVLERKASQQPSCPIEHRHLRTILTVPLLPWLLFVRPVAGLGQHARPFLHCTSYKLNQSCQVDVVANRPSISNCSFCLSCLSVCLSVCRFSWMLYSFHSFPGDLSIWGASASF